MISVERGHDPDVPHAGRHTLTLEQARVDLGERRAVFNQVSELTMDGQRADPGVTVIMGGIGVAILGVALLVLVLRMLLAQAVARDVEAAQMQAELDEVI